MYFFEWVRNLGCVLHAKGGPSKTLFFLCSCGQATAGHFHHIRGCVQNYGPRKQELLPDEVGPVYVFVFLLYVERRTFALGGLGACIPAFRAVFYISCAQAHGFKNRAFRGQLFVQCRFVSGHAAVCRLCAMEVIWHNLFPDTERRPWEAAVRTGRRVF